MRSLSSDYAPVMVRVSGDLALFTRPEMKVERVTYPVMTPSAARGVLEAIFWRPQMAWVVREVRVLKPIRYVSFVRNEVTSRASRDVAASWERDGGGYSAAADRAQRHSLALRDVAYVIVADAVVRAGVDEDPAKYRDQFRRRVSTGRCFQMPYLGCREFVADFEEARTGEPPVDLTMDLGPMLREVIHDGSGSGRPVFFQARLESGILRVPPVKEG